MNTPAHLIFGLAAFSKADRAGVTAAAALGALAPDLSLYALAGWALIVAQIPPEVVFGELYFSDTWQTIFAIDNSVFLWTGALALGLWKRWPVLVAFAGAGLLHLAFDLPLHHDDGRAHFWPLTDWVYASPFSYWDVARGAGWIAPLEVAASLALAVVVWRRHRTWVMGGILALACTAQLAVGGIWAFIF